jgi:probable F420-dependent oxidoreductase
MKFGVWIPNCRHLATPDIIRRTAVRAEQLGYDSVWVSDHVVVPHANVDRIGEAIFDPLVTLAVTAGATSRVRLGTTVLIIPYRNAVVTAKMVSSLDALSGGRVVLGIGAGWLAEESAMLGVPFAERGAMTDEYLLAMQELWTSPAPSFAGTYTQFGGLAFEPKPLQKPHPPIFQPFASSETSIRWCAREGVTAILPPLHPKRERALFELYAAESGRPFGEGIGYLRDLIIADSDAEARALWGQSAGFVGGAWFAPFGFNRGLTDPDTGEMLTAEQMMELGLVLVGTVDTVKRQLDSMRGRLPIDWIFAWMYNGVLPNARLLATIETFARDVSWA